ncbi:hypothetical protein HYV10_03270 [Candidatus Dependentiae bacterium]|nr:hypothetical protein [Candidatus Dependentiae bacterium]
MCRLPFIYKTMVSFLMSLMIYPSGSQVSQGIIFRENYCASRPLVADIYNESDEKLATDLKGEEEITSAVLKTIECFLEDGFNWMAEISSKHAFLKEANILNKDPQARLSSLERLDFAKDRLMGLERILTPLIKNVAEQQELKRKIDKNLASLRYLRCRIESHQNATRHKR